jgi:hypothetical protein
MIRPVELRAIRDGAVDLAFRRWDRPRVKVGTRLRTAVGLVEVTAVERVAPSRITAAEARRAGATSLAELRGRLAEPADRPVWRVGLRHAGADPREALREQLPDDAERARLEARLDRLDAAAADGPWTRETLRLVERRPGVRAPDLAASVGRETAEFKRDVRKLKELGLTVSLDVGYRLSPRGAALLGVEPPALPSGTPLPRVGAPASRALAAAGVATLEDVAGWRRDDLLALHGVGPHAVRVLGDALAGVGLDFAG